MQPGKRSACFFLIGLKWQTFQTLDELHSSLLGWNTPGNLSQYERRFLRKC
jgi:hypothetical protein